MMEKSTRDALLRLKRVMNPEGSPVTKLRYAVQEVTQYLIDLTEGREVDWGAGARVGDEGIEVHEGGYWQPVIFESDPLILYVFAAMVERGLVERIEAQVR